MDNETNFQSLYQMYLLFNDKCEIPSIDSIRDKLRDYYGNVEAISKDKELRSFVLNDLPKAIFDNGKTALSPQVIMSNFSEFNPKEEITELMRSQMWHLEDCNKLLENVKYKIMISDFMSSTLNYKDRAYMLSKYAEAAISLFPQAVGIWFPSSEKLLSREQVLNNPYKGPIRFLLGGLNIRFFKVEGTEDMIIDTVGFNAINLPDLQYHFHGLDPNLLVNHAFNVACYVFENNAPINSGETIDGIDKDGNIDVNIPWKCQYEDAMVEPERGVMDICPREYASGNRQA